MPQPPRNRPRRTFFASKLDLSASVAPIVTTQLSAVSGQPARKQGDKMETIGLSVPPQQRQRKPQAKAKVYTSKTKTKAKAIMTRLRSAKDVVLGRTRRSIISVEAKDSAGSGKETRSIATQTALRLKEKVIRGSQLKTKTVNVKSLAARAAKAQPVSPAIESSPAAVSTAVDSASEPVKIKLPKKEYMAAGFYCQDPTPSASNQLVNKVLRARAQEVKQKPKATKASSSAPTRRTRGAATKMDSSKVPIIHERPTLPPMPYDHGHDLFFGQQHDFELPWHIRFEAENGLLVRKVKPTAFHKLRYNVYPERQRIPADWNAVCRCTPESRCGENCINRIMSYLCGKDCPAGDSCDNRTLTRRTCPGYKIVHTGARGFGIFLTQDVKEGDFVMDYRGEVISRE
ncbi:hypothetical protein IAU60_001322 [Kwoniella sp. DSM 27419]